MITPELPPNKLTLEETDALMEDLRRVRIDDMKETVKLFGGEWKEEDENILLEIQREKGCNLGRDYFSPIQIGELSNFFRINEEYIRNMSVADAMILDDAYQGTHDQRYSDTEERLGKTPFELEEDAERSLREIKAKMTGNKDEDIPPTPLSSRF